MDSRTRAPAPDLDVNFIEFLHGPYSSFKQTQRFPPEPLERETNSSESFSSLNLLSDQADLVYSRSPRNVNNVDHVVETQLCITLDEHRSFIPGLKDFRELIPQVLFGHCFLIDRDSPVPIDGDYDSAIQGIRVWRRGTGWGRLRDLRIQPFRDQGCDHHEDDDQNQENIDQRGDVDVRFGAATHAYCYCHSKYLQIRIRLLRLAGAVDFGRQ